MSFIRRLHFVKKQHEHNDIYTFYFSRPTGLKHTAGQHGVFILPGLYHPHPFTVSSSPEEEYITISTHVDTGSRYKRRLMSMKENDSLFMYGPILNFTLTKTRKQHVFLAQGIGMTPFRSMLVHAHANTLPITTTLIHVDSEPHTFRKLTEMYATKSYFPTTSEEFQAYVKAQDIDQIFYISGSSRFIKSTRELLYQQGITKYHIKTDSFLGY